MNRARSRSPYILFEPYCSPGFNTAEIETSGTSEAMVVTLEQLTTLLSQQTEKNESSQLKLVVDLRAAIRRIDDKVDTALVDLRKMQEEQNAADKRLKALEAADCSPAGSGSTTTPSVKKARSNFVPTHVRITLCESKVAQTDGRVADDLEKTLNTMHTSIPTRLNDALNWDGERKTYRNRCWRCILHSKPAMGIHMHEIADSFKTFMDTNPAGLPKMKISVGQRPEIQAMFRNFGKCIRLAEAISSNATVDWDNKKITDCTGEMVKPCPATSKIKWAPDFIARCGCSEADLLDAVEG